MRGHRDQGADRNDTGAADAGYQEVIATVDRCEFRLRKGRRIWLYVGAGFLLPHAALDGDEARAETVHTGEVLVAVVLVDLTLASEGRLLRDDAQAVGFDRAVAAAFADEIIDDNELLRIFHLPALAPAAFLGRAGLGINQDRDAGDLAQFALDRIEFPPVRDRHAGREVRCAELLRLIGDERDTVDAFRAN